MTLNEGQRKLIIAALHQSREVVVRERKRDADDMSSKWNDYREQKARMLDKQRDDLDELISEIQSQSGSISW